MPEVSGPNEIAAATIRLEATGGADARAEIDALKSKIGELEKQIQSLNGESGGHVESDSGGGGGSGGSGLGGMFSQLRKMGRMFGVGLGIKYFIDMATEISKANTEAIKFSATLTKMQGDAAASTATVIQGVRENLLSAQGVNPELLRTVGPSRRAIGGAAAKAVGDAADALQAARTADAESWSSGWGLLSPEIEAASRLFGVSAAQQRLLFAQQNYAGTVQMQTTQQLRSRGMADQMDAMIRADMVYANPVIFRGPR